MRLAHACVGPLGLVGLVVLGAGCASGGGGRLERDAGNPTNRDDAGMVGAMDSGPVVPDSGPAPTPDSGPAPLPDSGPPPACTVDADCDDHLVCTGVERCQAGSCVSGTPPVCDDGISCTQSRCVEGTPMCEHIPDDSLCPAGQTCGATGCTSSCAESPCRLTSPQCGCATGQGCYLNGTARQCGAAGTATEGTSCSGPTSCQPGLICLNVSVTSAAVNQCNRFCDSDSDCVGAGSLCAYTLSDGAGGSIPGVRVCSRSCDPITSAGCVSNAVCHVYREMPSAGRFFTDCAGPAGFGFDHDFCIDNTDCERGFFCAESFGECLAYCNPARGSADCVFGDTCYRFATPLIVGGTEYGYCDF